MAESMQEGGVRGADEKTLEHRARKANENESDISGESL